MASDKDPKMLDSLLAGLEFAVVNLPSNVSIALQPITAITADSRRVAPGALFFAVTGHERDGHDYMLKAVDRGCAAIVCMRGKIAREQLRKLPVTVIEVENTAVAYAAAAANYCDRPAEKMHLIGVTGTNGKTTVTYLLEHVLLQAGYNVGVVGTVTNRYTTRDGVGKKEPAQLTTPEALELQLLLKEMADSHVDYVIMEVSSHGLSQSRIATLLFDTAAFTNLSRDHLDYHPDMADYFGAKLRLFTDHLRSGGTAVLPQVTDASDYREWLESLHDVCRLAGNPIISWGRGESATIRLQSFASTIDQTEVVIETPGGLHRIVFPLVGYFNIENMLTVYGLCLATGIKESLILEALTTAVGAPGRIERITADPPMAPDSPVILVDYAHTPDALEKVLSTVKELPHGRLFCVFGCGGNRDQGKRGVMGGIAARLSDIAIITDDNPRCEDPGQIIDQIVAGMDSRFMEIKPEEWLAGGDLSSAGAVIIRDRQKAIQAAIKAASSGDIVVIAGKGHEPYQLTQTGKRFFDDRLEAKRILNSWTSEQVCAAVSGTVVAGKTSSRLLGQIVTDSRIKGTDTVFVALRGDTHDAHLFAPQAVGNGASCVVVEKKLSLPVDTGCCQLQVKDTLNALGDLAAFRRRRLAEKYHQVVIGLTGSCGKTTVKEMTSAILERKWPEGPDLPRNCVLKTRGNFNNLVGLPLSLLPLDVHHKAAVLEMGMNRPGELRRLGAIADPDISCITNIHGAHLEGLDSIEGVARAKEELFAVTKKSAVLVVNLDDPWVRQAASAYPQRKITFSTRGEKSTGETDVWSSGIEFLPSGTISFTLHHGSDRAEIILHIAGEHNVGNALCAAAISLAAGADLGHIQAGLADFRAPDKRMEMLRAAAGFALINDTYNANPASMAAGLKTLKQMAGRNAIAVIGDMLELGDTARQAHYGIGKLLAELGIDYAGVVGEFKGEVVRGALDHGFDKQSIRGFADKDDAGKWINELVGRKILGQDDMVLVKASRGLRFETIVAKLIA